MQSNHRYLRAYSPAERIVIVSSMFLGVPGAWVLVFHFMTMQMIGADPSTKPFILIAAAIFSLILWVACSCVWYVILAVVYRILQRWV